MALSGKAKFKNKKKNEKFGYKVKILSANLLFDCFNGANFYRPLTGTICRIKQTDPVTFMFSYQG